ncbi:MAG: DUF6561 domain-containing protein [Prochlorococcus sp.]
MTIKLMLLKSGEDIIADVAEMAMGEEENKRVVGYFLKQPCVVKMRNPNLTEEDGNNKKAGFEVSLFPWMPLSKEKTIPITAEWVITMVEPITTLKEMYTEDIVNYGKDDQNSSTDEQTDPDQ